MTDEAAGERIKRRRLALGMTVKALAERAGVDRGRLAAIETGASAREATIGAIERALSEFEAETGHDEEPPKAGSGSEQVTFRLAGNFGVDVVVQGPVENLPELEASVERLIQRMRSTGADRE